MANPDDDEEAASKEARAESVSRLLSGDDPPKDTEQPSGAEGQEGKMTPEGVGESVSHRGEDMVDEEGKEAGRDDTGTDDTPAQRPTGTSTARDATGVDPQDD